MTEISLKHPDRLRAIVESSLGLLLDAGFVPQNGSYNVASLTGRLDLQSSEAVLRLTLRNDDLDIDITAPGDLKGPWFRASEVVQYLENKPVDYVKFQHELENPPPPRFESPWEYDVDCLKTHLTQLVAFVEQGDLANRRVSMDAFFAARSTELQRQMRAYRDARRATSSRQQIHVQDSLKPG
jgi:hypothetical protein